MTKKIEKKLMLWQIFCSILGILLILSILTKGFIGCPLDDGNSVIPQDEEEKEELSDKEKVKSALKQISRESINVEGDFFIGSDDAQVTIIEFSNFQCSACKNHFLNVYPQIYKELVETGKVKYYVKPIGIKEFTEAVECANDQGRYEQMHEELFNNMANVDSLDDYAKNIGLNVKEFNECMDSGKYTSKIQKYLSEASSANIRGTPIFFVNGIRLEGTYPFETFNKIVDLELEE